MTDRTPALTPDEQSVLRLYGQGGNVNDISAELAMPRTQVRRIIREFADDDRQAARSLLALQPGKPGAAKRITVAAGEVEQLLADAARSPRARTRRVGLRVERWVAELRELLAQEQAARAAAQRVAQLTKELAEARATAMMRARPTATRRRRTVMTAFLVRRIQAMVADGMPAREVARQLEIDPKTVIRHAQQRREAA